MQKTFAPNSSSISAPNLNYQEGGSWHCRYSDSSTAMTSPDGTILRFDSAGRITSISSKHRRGDKTFSYSLKGVLLEICMQGYRLSRVGNEWTDGLQLFDIDVTVDNIGVVTVIERGCAAITRLHPNGSFVIAVAFENGKQFSIHHNAEPLNSVDRIEYPDGVKRYFRFNKTSELTLLDEDDGYWLKVNELWLHYNSMGQHDGQKAFDILVDFNGTIVFHYLNDTQMTVTAFGERSYGMTPIAA
ncbi:hypothetical protein BH10CYA1_BH10CYA1_40640 [soil metagenome]